MNILILRHGIAVDPAEWTGSDGDRPLTADGQKKLKKVAKGLRRLGVSFDHILTSPLRRAHDTAHLIAKEFKASRLVRLSRLLAPDGDSKRLVQHLGRDYRSWESVLLVGHEPYLSRLISILVSGHPDAGIELKKGGACLLSADSLTYDRCARLEWLVQPKLAKKLK